MSEPNADRAALQRIVDSVISRLGERVRLVRKTVSIGDWQPRAQECHDNVARWVAGNPEHKHVFGFVLFDYRLLNGCIRISAHSVVEDENRTLCDITPHEMSADYPFIRHIGSTDDFAVLVNQRDGSVDAPI